MPQIIKPGYIDPAGDPRLSQLSVSPPFMFRNVTARVFPLKANMSVLTQFCDQYLNMDIPPSIVHYSPALPYVYLMVLNYGSMSAAVQAQNVGWVAQHEVAFTVPLQRWREENGTLTFKDWACVSPFIYVDDQLSLSTGREVYGWNKVTGTIDSDIPLWVTDPRAHIRQFDLSVVDFASVYAGESDEQQMLLQVDLDPPPTFTEFPPDPSNPWSPLWAVPNAVRSSATLLGSAMEILLAPRSRGYPTHRSLDSMRAMVGKAATGLSQLLPNLTPTIGRGQAATDALVLGVPTLGFDTVTLKQFRNPEDPALACYQAIVNSRMGLERLNRSGLLGDVNLLRGDSSGGFSILIHQYDTQPIIQTLGLEVASKDQHEGAGSVAILKPVLPFWTDVDLYYGVGEVICSRAHGAQSDPAGVWTDEQTDKAPADPTFVPKESLPLYNTALGAATQPITGPFHFPDVTLQVYPLLADRARLDAFLKNYLNDPLARMYSPGTQDKIQKGWRFEPFGTYVYMTVAVFGDELGTMWSGTNNIGAFFDREVGFCLPVKWYDENDELISVAMIEPFTYSNNGRAVSTDREVNGYNSIRATIDSPKDVWMTSNGPIEKRRFLHLETEVIPALDVGQKAGPRTLLEIDERDVIPADDEAGWRMMADNWGAEFIDELKRKTFIAAADQNGVSDAKALALEVLANGTPFNKIVLKQYRDATNADTACYQALVQVQSTITSIYNICEMPAGLNIRLHRCPGHLLVDALGLKVRREDSAEGEVIQTLQPVRPFWMRLGVKEELGTVACYRAEAAPWKIVHPWFQDPGLESASDSTARRMAGQQPYFRQSGETPVGSWLGRVGVWGADLSKGLKNQSTQWLRGSLTNELAWIRICNERWSADDQKKFLDAMAAQPVRITNGFTEPSLVDRFSRLQSAPSIQDFCDSEAAQDLLKLTADLNDAATSAGLTLADPAAALPAGPAPADSANVQSFMNQLAAVGAWVKNLQATAAKDSTINTMIWGSDGVFQITSTVLSLSLTLEGAGKLSSMTREAFCSSLADVPRRTLKDLAAFQTPVLVGQNDKDVGANLQKLDLIGAKLQQAKDLAAVLSTCLKDWTNPTRWRRIKFAGAKNTIDALDDIQLVLDSILSCQWEDWSDPCSWVDLYGARKPDEFVPDEPDVSLRAADLGLERWTAPLMTNANKMDADKVIWVVAQPNPFSG